MIFYKKYPNYAFTLIELLVVIGVILILAGLLAPTINEGLKRSRQAHCKNNLHQFGIALSQYRHDFNEQMPDWLSNLYPDYINSIETFLCKSDRSGGKEGGKPDNGDPELGQDYQETDDTEYNIYGEDYRNRNTTIKKCSYMYEFANAECSWNLPGAQDIDNDGILTWYEVKIYQLNYGDHFHPGKYNEQLFPAIRCFHHYKEDTIEFTYEGEKHKQPMTINVSFWGNVFLAPIQWEYLHATP